MNSPDAISFFFVDVFADRPLEGNPLTVVPDAARLTVTLMQQIAREFNQSETTFILPPTRPEADWRLRSFTPAGHEASGGAGHHTLGAWWWMADQGMLQLTDAGGSFTQQGGDSLLPVEIACVSGQLASVSMSQRPPIFGRVGDPALLADALGLSRDDLATDRLPAQVVSTGVAHLLVPLLSRAAVTNARPDFPRLAAILQRLQGEGCYLFTLETIRPESSAHARFFNPTLGIVEDVATGTAAGPLACQLAAHDLADTRHVIHIEQGHSLGRPSVIHIRVAGETVAISGRCVVSGSGRLRIG